MPLSPLVIVGAGGMGREVAWLVQDINSVSPTWNLLGFVDESPELQDRTVVGYPVLGGRAWLKQYSAVADNNVSATLDNCESDIRVVIAIGTSATRRKLVMHDLEPLNLRYATLIHPSVRMATSGPMAARIGAGSIVCANSVLSVNVRVGDHVVVSIACNVSHDAIVEDFATLLPSVTVSGFSTLGSCTIIGTGSQVLECRTIGAGTIVGAGSVVVEDLPPDCTAVGAPAKAIKFHENGEQRYAFREHSR
jgi:sugar O-acyltransferase (sialic acid O-acetyltransferase NeuD family)